MATFVNRPLESSKVTCLKTFDFINTLLLHGDLLICGMINGRIKVWTLSDVNSNNSSPPQPRHGCQMAIAQFKDCMYLALRA